MWPQCSNKPILWSHSRILRINSWISNTNFTNNTPNLNTISVVFHVFFACTPIADMTVMHVYPYNSKTIADIVKLIWKHQRYRDFHTYSCCMAARTSSVRPADHRRDFVACPTFVTRLPSETHSDIETLPDIESSHSRLSVEMEPTGIQSMFS